LLHYSIGMALQKNEGGRGQAGPGQAGALVLCSLAHGKAVGGMEESRVRPAGSIRARIKDALVLLNASVK
jgi:hypothetical protein